jgi:hypothetical protein
MGLSSQRKVFEMSLHFCTLEPMSWVLQIPEWLSRNLSLLSYKVLGFFLMALISLATASSSFAAILNVFFCQDRLQVFQIFNSDFCLLD